MLVIASTKDIPFINKGLDELRQPHINDYNTVENYYISSINDIKIGFVNFTISENVMDLCGIYVAKDERQKGYANQMLDSVIDICKNKRINTIMIEVRPSNKVALILYKSHDFKPIAIRTNYYKDFGSREDAIIMRKKVHIRKEKV